MPNNFSSLCYCKDQLFINIDRPATDTTITAAATALRIERDKTSEAVAIGGNVWTTHGISVNMERLFRVSERALGGLNPERSFIHQNVRYHDVAPVNQHKLDLKGALLKIAQHFKAKVIMNYEQPKHAVCYGTLKYRIIALNFQLRYL